MKEPTVFVLRGYTDVSDELLGVYATRPQALEAGAVWQTKHLSFATYSIQEHTIIDNEPEPKPTYVYLVWADLFDQTDTLQGVYATFKDAYKVVTDSRNSESNQRLYVYKKLVSTYKPPIKPAKPLLTSHQLLVSYYDELDEELVSVTNTTCSNRMQASEYEELGRRRENLQHLIDSIREYIRFNPGDVKGGATIDEAINTIRESML
jgi:hypothetical protein